MYLKENDVEKLSPKFHAAETLLEDMVVEFTLNEFIMLHCTRKGVC